MSDFSLQKKDLPFQLEFVVFMSSVIKIKFFLVFLTKLVTNSQESKVLFLRLFYTFSNPSFSLEQCDKHGKTLVHRLNKSRICTSKSTKWKFLVFLESFRNKKSNRISIKYFIKHGNQFLVHIRVWPVVSKLVMISDFQDMIFE